MSYADFHLFNTYSQYGWLLMSMAHLLVFSPLHAFMYKEHGPSYLTTRNVNGVRPSLYFYYYYY